ncbi:sulfotransferase 1C2-like [Ylistrum balloti]|uniref:sulfotransferase 1C2-like n=1 Tax=Ylistrum balloti TaxID=509963 RepID=UPI002905E864|nr:sulfotransferase 1C2-like [Ylistrum balloti]
MELVEKIDDQGNTLIFKRYQGRTFSKNMRGNVGDQLKQVASLSCRPHDVLLCTFPKSGTHWVYNMARMIQTKTLRYSGTPVIIEQENIKVVDETSSPRMFHTHLPFPFIPKAAMEGQMKIIYVLRNPKDVAYSYYMFLSRLENSSYIGSFDHYQKVFLSEETTASGGSWFTHTKEWYTGMLTNQSLKILSLRFEDLKKNLYQNILQIAEFLGVDHDETFLRNVERAVSFENLKEKHATILGETERYKSLGDNGRLPIYRKGIVGEWKNVFTVAQNETFDAVYREKMGDVGLNLEVEYE